MDSPSSFGKLRFRIKERGLMEVPFNPKNKTRRPQAPGCCFGQKTTFPSHLVVSKDLRWKECHLKVKGVNLVWSNTAPSLQGRSGLKEIFWVPLHVVTDGAKAANWLWCSALSCVLLLLTMPRPLSPVTNKCCCCHVQANKLMWVEKPKLGDLGKLIWLSHGQWWC